MCNHLKDLDVLLKQLSGFNKYCIKSYVTKKLTSVGENYQSKIIGVDLKISEEKNPNEDRDLHVIIKIPPTVKNYREVFDLQLMFKKEIFMYNNILPAYKKFEIDNGVCDSELLNIAPTYYGSKLSSSKDIDLNDNALIVLENLRSWGYYTVDRRIGTDLNHSRLVIQAIAKFHSTGIAMKHKNAEEFEIIKDLSSEMKVKYPEDWSSVIENIFKLIASDVQMNKFLDSCIKLAELIRSNPQAEIPVEPWSTIIHGDFLIMNLLFRRSNNLKDSANIKFIDFQNYMFLNPLRELIFFLCTSTDQEVLNCHFDELVDLYYETLKNRLELFNFDSDSYTRDSFHKELVQNAQLEFLHCVVVLQILTLNFEKNDVDVENLTLLLKNSKIQENEIFLEKLRNLTSFYHQRGWYS
ncbi:uncharacterized protein LOC123266914 [Cotesia glomerata]|uniref:CHK kinase-like domain-containing protein n=1 Tax=Cotesia glomerata TaxID=32391 RepID=A0AAV7HUH0_COTGL|nr:uncharacterized protein LOC123266914 [Cotesia glomerata]KAH0534804.1 hypothetical protein KQX54_008709 [Cotesia glomerata]